MKVGSSFFAAIRLLRGRAQASPGSPGNRRARGRHSGGLWGATLGIGISMIPIVLVLVVSDGMIQGITDRYIATKTWDLQVSLPSGIGAGDISLGESALLKVPGIKSVIHELDASALAISGIYSHGIQLRAVDPAYFSDPSVKSYLEVKAGRMKPEKGHEIVVGSALAEELHLKVGSYVMILTTHADISASGLEAFSAQGLSRYSPKISMFKVSGIVDAGYRDLDSVWGFVSAEDGAALSAGDTSTEFLSARTINPYSAALAKAKDAAALSLKKVYPSWFEPYFVRTWAEMESNLYKSFSTTKSLLIYIMFIALLVAAVNLSSALFTFTLEHRVDIAVLRSFGVTYSQIGQIFVIAGFLTGSIGTVAGLLFGLLLSTNINFVIAGLDWGINLFLRLFSSIGGLPAEPFKVLDPGYYLSSIPVTINWGQLAVIAAASVLLCVVVAVFPAKKAMNSSPLELIRKI